MSTSAEMDEIFRQSVIEVIRRFSPEKKNIVVPPECLKELKEVVRANVLRTPRSFVDNAASHELRLLPSTTRRGSNDSVEDDDSRMSCDSSEEGRSNDDDSRSSAIEKIHKSSSLSSLPEGFKGSHKKMSRSKRLQELRAHRRKATEHEEFERIDCPDESEFQDYYFDWYSAEIVKGGDISYLYHRMVNTAQDYYSRITFPQNVNRMVSTFFRHHGVIEYSRLFGMYENEDRGMLEADRKILEMQLQVMLELYTITLETRFEKDEPADLKDILRKLRWIYISTDATILKGFLEEQVADNFNHIIPKEIARIFDKLCMNLPADLEEYDPNPNPWLADDYNPCARRLRAREETNKELQAMLEETSLSDNSTTGKENKKKAKDRKEESSSSQADVPKTPKRRESRHKVIPETPDDKLQSKDEHFDEIVKQTPMGKLRQAHKRGSRRLSELVKLSEERTRPTRAAAIASEKANKAIMSATVAPNITKESLFSLHTPSSRPHRSAKTNLIERFNSSMVSSSQSTPTSNGSSKRSRKSATEINEEPDKKRSRSCNSVIATPPVSPNSKNIPGLGKEQLLQYKKRMSEISKQKSPTVGAQTRARTSLFEDADILIDKPKVEQGSIQKNRTGREVRTSTTVHIAHILLNVHNPAPLLAFNAAKMKNTGVPRLQRLVRIAKKSQKIRLQRLRSRVRQSLAAANAITIE